MRMVFDSRREQILWGLAVTFGLGFAIAMVYIMVVSAIQGTWHVNLWLNWYGEAVPELVLLIIAMCSLAGLWVRVAYGETPT